MVKSSTFMSGRKEDPLEACQKEEGREKRIILPSMWDTKYILIQKFSSLQPRLLTFPLSSRLPTSCYFQ